MQRVTTSINVSEADTMLGDRVVIMAEIGLLRFLKRDLLLSCFDPTDFRW